ncbi:LuxR C-terminal-related transcriptional regulator [Enterobacillus tribolii]|uniref:Two-component system capsular synthesis response regulator RcsB n=1 Tax=Enterobacillus tribolii TaxID=1487935 RepID=A0A370QU44_9GAMM|nr:LuxR C-terminal-related transcriptional regulator [Enterobacillus tribolii]MBW7981173.1 response regulator transcription factor [Enterobacillus tribolii]RDK92768.1 two-component system capsular synthesis response regulator RcsB [Enterobacillus tribolii]
MIRIVLIEPYYYDSEGVRGCFADLKTQWHHFRSVEEFLCVKDMPDFDVLILGSDSDIDAALPRSNPFPAIKQHYPHIPVILFTRTEDPQGLAALAEQNPFAVISKQDNVQEIRNAVIRSLMEEEGVLISPYVQARLTHAKVGCNTKMTRMEQKVISWMLEGQTIGDIAQATKRSNKTISAHKRNAMRKLGLHNNIAFCRYLAARRQQVVSDAGAHRLH